MISPLPSKATAVVDKKVVPPPPAAKAPALRQITWLTDYGAAMKEAEQDKKYLLMLFEPATDRAGHAADVLRQLQDPRHAKSLSNFVLLRQSLEQTISSSGKKIRLISHASFGEMQGQAGLAVIDLANPNTPHYRQVVSQVPFSAGKYYRYEKSAVPALLSLPAGTLTQRSLILAVRMHPERPASAWGAHDAVLGEEAASHSHYQARIQNQGHHHWGQRFERIRGRLAQRRGYAGLPREVVAESWPQQNLLDSCADCVQSWRQSAGHWGAVRAQHASYSFDIKRGNNGIWYATGLFSD
ncbi:MAG: hypothetical protein SFX18_13025 [Pirellulales bacterium]|nr:hypothetical protein [Pirellulales bacterium]